MDFTPSEGHPDRLRWNARYAGRTASFAPHPLAERALTLPLPPGPVLDVACGTSGTTLLAAAYGRHVTAVDISDVALEMLGAEVRRRGLTGLVTLIEADLEEWRPRDSSYALALCTGYWDRSLFPAVASSVTPGGALAWEALTLDVRDDRPDIPAEWCLGPDEPAALLPADFTVLHSDDLGTKRRLLAAHWPCPIRERVSSSTTAPSSAIP
jgi:SAM-dependent methyltransferase